MDTSNQNQPVQGQPQIQQTVIVVGKQKSVGVAFMLALLFGPLGLLYASITGGIVMFILGILIGIITLGFGLILIWIGSIIWAVIAASNANKKMTSNAGLHINTNFGTQPQTQIPQQPSQQELPLQEEMPQQIISEPTKQSFQSVTPKEPSFDL